MERTFEFALTYERDTVARARTRWCPGWCRRSAVAHGPGAAGRRRGDRPRAAELPALVPGAGEGLLHRALAATTSGVVIVDMVLPDQPMVYVNRAFEELSGYPREEVLGRNCRFLQTADTDLAAVARIREAVDAGGECRETLLNHRGPDLTPWWNELHLAPVTDAEAGWCSTSACRTTSPPGSRPSSGWPRSRSAPGSTWPASSSWPGPTR